MHTVVRGSVTGLAMAAWLVALPAQAQQAARAETTVPSRLSVRDDCLFAPMGQMVERMSTSLETGFLAPILAGFAGNLAQGALTGISAAIRRASEEHGFTAVGSDGYMAGTLARGEAHGVSTYEMVATPRCLILAVPRAPARGGAAGGGAAAFAAYGLDLSGDDAADDEAIAQRNTQLAELGLKDADPAAYVEIALVPGREGVLVRPMFVWYRAPIASAGQQVRSTELLVELATPNFAANADQLGTLFAVSRIRLPRMQPGQAPMDEAGLVGIGATYLPYRPTTGSVGDRLNALKGAEDAVIANTRAKATTQRTLDVARAALAAAATPAAAQTARTEVNNAEYALTLADVELTAATNRRDTLRAASGTTQTVSSATLREPAWGEAGSVGATNARVSFIVVRDANRFGLAIADALSSQAPALGTAVTRELTPQAEWTPARLALLTATRDVLAKQASYDAAVATGVAEQIRTAHTALLLAKHSANAAAEALGEPAPHPGVMQEAQAGVP